MSDLKPVKYEDYKVGDSAEFTKTITEKDVMTFAEVTGDFNPIHVNPEFGPGILYGGQTVKFVKPVFFGDTCTAVATVKEMFTKKEGKLKFIICDTIVKNQNDEIVTTGEGTIIFM